MSHLTFSVLSRCDLNNKAENILHVKNTHENTKSNNVLVRLTIVSDFSSMFVTLSPFVPTENIDLNTMGQGYILSFLKDATVDHTNNCKQYIVAKHVLNRSK